MKIKTLSISICAAIFLSLSLSSCDDARLSKELQGSWKSDMTTTLADGTKCEEEFYMTFNHVESSGKDGGEYTETRIGKANFEEDGMFAKVEYTITVNGEYEVLVGDLNIKYHTSTLDVSIDKVNFGASKDADFFTQANMLGSVMDGSWSETRRLMKQQAKQELYQACYEQYQESNENEKGYGNMKIEGNTLSFDTDDMGRVNFTKSN